LNSKVAVAEISLPYVAGSETSKAAAESMVARDSARASRAQTDRQRISDLVYLMGVHGATTEEIETALDMKHQTASARVSELANRLGVLKNSGKTRPTRSNRQAVVYVFAHPESRS
jgi:hypothetical protein